ncbi:galactose-1-epimerase [Niveispirillum lacus]|uniref:Aldose 1-epimerase n=2 Tax=Niveispirillum lacus TaxID=1981099 RepID=A0A255YQ47_9PROT|nr:galactose-1-epimerase [Niveispirillum lacus]
MMPPAPALAGRGLFGTLPDGTPVEWVTLVNRRGAAARLIGLGASLQALWMPDREGRLADIVLGHDDLATYLANRTFLGAIVGRYANRLAGGRFALDEKSYQTPCNDGPNCLHGGVKGLDLVPWTLFSHSPNDAVFTYQSPDGEEGFPGTVDITARYHLDEDNILTVEITATTDAPTVINLTNHAYFNLGSAGAGGDILDHELTLAAAHYTPVDGTLIPTGEVRDVTGSPFDFRTPHRIGARIRDAGEPQLLLARGYDHNFVLDAGGGREPAFAARVVDPFSGRTLDLFTTEPGLQFYSGNFLPGNLPGKGGRLYRQSDALCLEPQKFPDSPNQPSFPSARLEPGQVYRHVSSYRFGIAD